MVAIVSITLLAIIWHQPYVQVLTVCDMFGILWTTASAAIKTITNAWTHMYAPYRLAIILIRMMLYSKSNQRRKYQQWPCMSWMWNTSMSAVSSLGDWIERVSQPSPTYRRRRIQHAITRLHRSNSDGNASQYNHRKGTGSAFRYELRTHRGREPVHGLHLPHRRGFRTRDVATM